MDLTHSADGHSLQTLSTADHRDAWSKMALLKSLAVGNGFGWTSVSTWSLNLKETDGCVCVFNMVMAVFQEEKSRSFKLLLEPTLTSPTG